MSTAISQCNAFARETYRSLREREREQERERESKRERAHMTDNISRKGMPGHIDEDTYSSMRTYILV